MRRFSHDFTPRAHAWRARLAWELAAGQVFAPRLPVWRQTICSSYSSTASPQPAFAQPLPVRRFGEHAGIGFRPPELRIEGHELVAAECMDRHPLSGAPLRERCIQSGPPRAQAIDSDDHIAGSDARSLRGAAFENVRDAG